MNQRQIATATSLLHAANYAAARTSDFSHNPARPVDAKFATVLASLNATVTALGGKHAIQKGDTYHQHTTAQAKLRDQLEEEVSDAIQTASSIVSETGETALLAHFHLPGRHNDAVLAATARTMVTAIRKHALNAAFESYGWPEDSARHLETLVESFEQSEGDQGGTLGEQVGATASIPRLLRLGRAEVKKLNTIFRRIYKAQPEILEGWRSASHVAKAPVNAGIPEESGATVTPPPAPAPGSGEALSG